MEILRAAPTLHCLKRWHAGVALRRMKTLLTGQSCMEKQIISGIAVISQRSLILQKQLSAIESWKKLNLDKIKDHYDPENITDRYEEVMLNACGVKKMIIQPAAAAAV